MSIFTNWLSRLERGFAAFATCFFAGAMLAFAFAPTMFWPVIFLSLPLFYHVLMASASTRQAALRGFAFGYGFFIAGTWWIANSMLVDAAKFAWMMPFSILGLSAVLALYFMLFGAAMHRLRHPNAMVSLLRFSSLWIAFEYLRSLGQFGFPWNLAGYVALASTSIAQLASVIGTFGLGFLVILTATAPVLLRNAKNKTGQRLGLILPLLIIAVTYSYGTARLPKTLAMTQTDIRIVQPNIPQALKHTKEGEQQSLATLLRLSAAALQITSLDTVTLWPESSYPDVIRSTETNQAWPFSTYLLSGAVAAEGQGRDLQIFNSLIALDKRGHVEARYDKHQLVPFGEFVPLRSVLPLNKITPGDLDFSRGHGATTIALGTLLPFSPLVCYEVIFPWMSADASVRPQWLVNVTNDGWYGDSPGPYQHFAAARMRAIEQGLPLARAANTGISALIDPYGRVVSSLVLSQRGVIDARLPAALPPTIYARHGERLTLISLIFLWVATFLPSWRQKK